MMNYRLKQARKLRGMSLREAAKGLGMSHEGLNRFEKGILKMDSEKLAQFAKFYNVKIDYLIENKNRIKVEFGEWHLCKINKYA